MVVAIMPLIIVIILFVIVGKFGIAKVIGVRAEIASAQETERTLTQKLSILQTLSPDITLKANLVASALPEGNPTLAVISQLKVLAASQGVVLSSVKSLAGVQNSSDLNATTVSFSLVGLKPQVFAFLNEIPKIAPITIVDKIRVTGNVGSITADISVKSYWADFPKTIPSVTDPITDLTASDKDVLNKVSGLTQPTFIKVTPSQEGVNPNPFGQ